MRSILVGLLLLIGLPALANMPGTFQPLLVGGNLTCTGGTVDAVRTGPGGTAIVDRTKNADGTVNKTVTTKP